MPRLPFISLDGLDGAGKSTQCRLLAAWLRACNYSVSECHDPGGTALGGEIRSLLLSHRGSMSLLCEALLFMASRAQLIEEVIRPALDGGQIVISDRFLLANVVYQGHAGGLDPQLLWEVGLRAAHGLQPDLTLVLDIPVEASAARRRGPADRIERRDHAYHERVREGFLTEARQRLEHICIVDARAPVDKVQERLRAELSKRFPALCLPVS
jgi:dTMP kinase